MEERFAFGKNWAKFLSTLDEDRILAAQQALCDRLGVTTLEGSTFLDIGSGSGLSSLAARRLGARVRSFDFDTDSVACTGELRRRHFTDDPDWIVEAGSALDETFMRSLGQYDVVYAWGVLHHTGSMWKALDLAAERTRPGGKLFIAIYNDQGVASRRWTFVKRSYVRAPGILKPAIVGGVAGYLAARAAFRRVGRFSNPIPVTYFKERKTTRGMSVWHDLVDWVGGYPFEVARPEEIFRFFRDREFSLEELTTCGGSFGCNEFVFTRRESNR